jgi:copper transport protein
VRPPAVFLALLAAAWLAPAAFAHANVVSTMPRDGETLPRAPAEVRVLFDDPVSVGPGNAVVTGDRTSVLAGRPRVERAGRELVLPLQPLANGDYSARWRIVSDDGHLESGVLAFRIGQPQAGAAAPRSVLEAEPGRPSTSDVLARWLLLGGILVAGGAALFRLLVTRARAPAWAATVTLALIAVVVGGAWLLHISHAGSTRFGHVTDAAVLVAAGGAFVAALSRLYPRVMPLAMVAPLALLFAPTAAGHAFRPADDRPLSAAADFLHVAAAAFWLGGLVQLALVLWGRADPSAAGRFSKLALPAVLVLAAAGVGRAIVELTSFSQLWSTGYGRAILVKSALFVVLIGLAWFSRGRLGSAARLLRSVAAEIAVLALVVVAVAVLTALRPGRDVQAQTLPSGGPTQVARPPAPPRGAIVLARDSEELAVALAIQPGSPLRLTATIVGQTGFGVDGLDVGLAAANASRGASIVGQPCGPGCDRGAVNLALPNTFTVTINGAGRFRSVDFPLPGAWPPRPGQSFVRRATRVFDGLRSAVFLEHLRSRPGNELVTTWKLAAPDRLEYSIRGGAGGIVIGKTRWDRAAPGAPWKRSAQGIVLPQPTAPWGPRIRDAHVLTSTPDYLVVSWVDPQIPAWFTATFDRRTALPTRLSMTSAAHFMRHRYLSYNQPLEIAPP